jgi:hypothetical protein
LYKIQVTSSSAGKRLEREMKMDLYTWGGTYFGKRDRDDLWTYDGRHVGRFWGHEVFDKRGRYIGELKNGRLITNTSKRLSRSGPSFSPYPNRAGHDPYADQVGSVMPDGYEDFPSLRELNDNLTVGSSHFSQ